MEFNPGAAVGGLFAPGIGELVGGLASPTYGYDATTGQTFSYSSNPVASAVGGGVSDLFDLGFNYGDEQPGSASAQATDAREAIATGNPGRGHFDRDEIADPYGLIEFPEDRPELGHIMSWR